MAEFLRPNESSGQLLQRCSSTNASQFDCSEEEMLWLMMGPRTLPLVKLVPISVVLCSIFLTGVAGNVAVCVVIIRHPAMHTATNYYLFSLALSDLLLLLFGLPNDLTVSWHQYPYSLGIVFCKLRALISEAASYVSVLTIVAFSLERYLAICHPLHLYAMAGLRRALKIVAALWLLSLLAAAPFAMYTTVSYHDYPPGSGNASLESAFCAMLELPSWYLCELSSLLFFILPGIIILCLYVRMGARIRYVMGSYEYYHQFSASGAFSFHPVSHRTPARDRYFTLYNNFGRHESTHTNKPGQSGTLHGVNGSVHGEARQAQSKKNIIRMLAAVVIAFFVCWAPFHFQRLFFIYGTASSHYHIINEYLFYVAGGLYYISATVNPILYNVMSHRYRLAFHETLCCGRVRRKKSRREHSSIRETTVNHTSDGTNLVKVHSRRRRSERHRRSSFTTEATSVCSDRCPQYQKNIFRKGQSNNNEGNQLIFSGYKMENDDVSC